MLTDNQLGLRDCIDEERGRPMLTCDYCYATLICDTGDEDEIAIQADERGWKYRHGSLCPDCK